MIEACSRCGSTLELVEGPRGSIEPAQKAKTDDPRRRLAATDNAVRFPVEGSWPNRPHLPDNRWTLRIPTRSEPSPATSRRRQEEWVRQKQSQRRRLQSDGREGEFRTRRPLYGESTRTSKIHRPMF